jgi:DNA-binding MarR family transcriptional regulator
MLLIYLLHEEGSLPVGNIAEEFGMTVSSVKAILRKMEQEKSWMENLFQKVEDSLNRKLL